MRPVAMLLALIAAWPCAAAEEPSPPGACHTGAYALADGSHVVVQPSDAPNLRYRFPNGRSGKLFPVSDHRYESGEGWSVREPVTLSVEFGECGEGFVRMRQEGRSALEGRRVPLPTIPVTFRSRDATLYGEFVMPPEGRPRVVVVLQYGGARESAVAHNFVQYLLPLEGIAVFVFDKRGTGRSTGGFSIEIGTLADDMAAAVRAVRARREARDVPLGLMGESQGGWVAPLAASRVAVDFVVVSYGLAVSMLEEDRQEVAQSLRAGGYGPDVLARGDEIHRATARVMMSRFRDGLHELERLKSMYGNEPWFAALGGDFTAPLTATPEEQMPEVQAAFDFPYDLAYDPLPVLEKLTVPQLWILAAADTEAPHESTLARLRGLQAKGLPIDVLVFRAAEHGMIAVEQGPQGRRLAGRTVEGYYQALTTWIAGQGSAANRPVRQQPAPSHAPPGD